MWGGGDLVGGWGKIVGDRWGVEGGGGGSSILFIFRVGDSSSP